jgi:hypothetical protein
MDEVGGRTERDWKKVDVVRGGGRIGSFRGGE